MDVDPPEPFETATPIAPVVKADKGKGKARDMGSPIETSESRMVPRARTRDPASLNTSSGTTASVRIAFSSKVSLL